MADTTSEPLTAEKLQAIRAELTVYQTHNGAQGDHLVLHHLPTLLAEVERLQEQVERQATVIGDERGRRYDTMDTLGAAQEKARAYGERVDAYMKETLALKAKNAAMREIVQAVSCLEVWPILAGRCPWCLLPDEQHTTSCIVPVAKRLKREGETNGTAAN